MLRPHWEAEAQSSGPVVILITGFTFLCEGEGDCTRETSRGQFNIFGAIEEICGGEFLGVNDDEENSTKRMVRGVNANVFAAGELRRSQRRTRAGALYTVRAQEMQKDSSQFSLLSQQLAVSKSFLTR
jgi:hypothetical protein